MSCELPFALPSVDSVRKFLAIPFLVISAANDDTSQESNPMAAVDDPKKSPSGSRVARFVLFDPAAGARLFQGQREGAGLFAHCLDLIAQTIGLRCLAHGRIRPSWPDIRNVREAGGVVSRSRNIFWTNGHPSRQYDQERIFNKDRAS